MTISALFIATNRGKLLVFRGYRDEYTQDDAEMFCANYIRDALEPMKPIYNVSRHTFARVPVSDLNLVAISSGNANCMLVLHCLCELRNILVNFLCGAVSQQNVTNNASTFLELLDEIINGGYPINFYEPLLRERMSTKMIPHFSKLRVNDIDPNLSFRTHAKPTVNAPFMGRMGIGNLKQDHALESYFGEETSHKTGALPWRPVNVHYRKNYISFQLIERLNMLINQAGDIVHFEVWGSLEINSGLSGFPQVQVRINDTFEKKQWPCVYQQDAGASEFKLPIAAKKHVTLDDFKFHTCVDLKQLTQWKTIAFTPSDGAMMLMIYRCSKNLTPPFIIKANVTKTSSLVLQYEITLKPTFSKSIAALDVVLEIPLPSNAKETRVLSKSSNTNFMPLMPYQLVKWSLARVEGGEEYSLVFHSVQSVSLDSPMEKKSQSIQMHFVMEKCSSSGLYIESATVMDRKLSKSAEYCTVSGNVVIRLQSPH
ncbi:bifunctional AP-2 complex subunit mu [Babesia duncani]|uniref:Bifunctional AP-2 complex subunit mu n=1 Tax=Babesia duncani TaxID=323732 RepID=A0AAD9PIV7_9APIC|nr:bifunctional AP-2 complex subunit mu [Babesia duncani]